VPHPVFKAVSARANQYCEHCVAPERIFNQEFEVDHVVPTTLGGLDELEKSRFGVPIMQRSKGCSSTRHNGARKGTTLAEVAINNPDALISADAS